MKSRNHKPAWWLLFVLLIGMLGMLLLESRDGAFSSAHELIDGIIVVGFFCVILGWLHFNMPELEKAELKHASLSEFRVVEFEPKQSTLQAKQSSESHFLVENGSLLVFTEKEN